MNKIAALAVSSMLLASVALAEVKEDCSAQLNGAVRCEFTNTGKKKDSACVVVEMVRLYNADVYSRSSLGGKGAVLSSDKICSGLVEPQDVRERASSVSWAVNGLPMTPYQFCDSNNPWFKAPENCLMKTTTVPD
ncbi:Hypothetical protein PPUBIRD1_0583 [Pseudomonas putida BIRD-1]|uniref:hypothetical protein n=1 Tax=Pseudomonas putida TaxID=303 RepID=UPI0001F32651|nr:hypothetical protein [Pseudomonas putida]ADR58275.1 Hypothetical protein PPUBIRD1_0583 [Pseudomonas putida BIRD-1]